MVASTRAVVYYLDMDITYDIVRSGDIVRNGRTQRTYKVSSADYRLGVGRGYEVALNAAGQWQAVTGAKAVTLQLSTFYSVIATVDGRAL